jgi:putative hemolysin
VSALFSASETVLNTLGPHRIVRLIAETTAAGKRHRFLETWANHRNEALACLLIGNTLVNIAISAIATSAFENGFEGTAFGPWAIPISVFVTTFVVLTFGEIIPKTFAQNNALRLADATRVLYPIYLLLIWPIRFFTSLSAWVIRKSGGSVENDEMPVVREDLMAHVARAGAQGHIDQDETRVLDAVLGLDGTVVHDVMKPRTEIVGIPHDAALLEILSIVEQNRHSRYPVYREDLDTILGFLYARDLTIHLVRQSKDGQRAPFEMQAHLRQPIFVPESKPVLALLREFQRSRVHLAVVVDEFGGTAGLVTIEDAMEEVFGEIYDEYDRGGVGEDLVRKIADGLWEVEAKISIIDLESALDTDIFPDDDLYSTVGGFILAEAGRIPEVGTTVALGSFRFTVLDADSKRVIRLRIEKVASHERLAVVTSD